MARLLKLSAAGPGPAGGEPPLGDPSDPALLRGEAVFETIRVYDGRPFRLDAHLERLARSAAAVGVELDGVDVEKVAGQAVDGVGDAALRVVCTKGPEEVPGG